MNSRRNLLLCLSHCVTTDGYGFQKLKEIPGPQMKSRKKKEIIFLKDDTRHSETWYHEMLPPGQPRNVAMQALELGKQGWRLILISGIRSKNRVRKLLWTNTAIFSICIKQSLELIHMKNLCAYTLQGIILWADYGLTMS